MRLRILPVLALSIFAACEGPAATNPMEESAASPGIATPVANATVGSIEFPANATLIDFEGVGTVGEAAPAVTADGVTVTFGGLIVTEVGNRDFGFSGTAGPNQVVESDRAELSGRLLTGEGPLGGFRTNGYVRSFDFDRPVDAVTLSIADIDVGERVVVTAFSESGAQIAVQDYSDIRLDSRVEILDWRNVTGISRITMVGNDPVGIDNLRFVAPIRFAVPAARTLVDFDAMGPLGAAAESFVASDGTTLTFEGLTITEPGYTGVFSFNHGGTQHGEVIEAEREWFSGRFLTQSERGVTAFVRRISFDRPVDDVSFFIADIDVQEGIRVRALDGNGAELASQNFPASLNLSGRVALVDLSAVSGIRTIEAIGSDPTGIDNLRFTAPNPPVVTVSGPATADAGATVTFAATVTPGDGAITSTTWDFGDGATGSEGSHAWAEPGTYTVTLTATDALGVQGSATTSIEVVAVPASVNLSGVPETLTEGDVVQIVTNVVEGTSPVTSSVLVRERWNEKQELFYAPVEFEVGVGETTTEWVAGSASTWRWTVRVQLEDGTELEDSRTVTVESYPWEVFAPETVVAAFGEPIAFDVGVRDASASRITVSTQTVFSAGDGECWGRSGPTPGLPPCYHAVELGRGTDGEVERTGEFNIPVGYTVEQLAPGETRTFELRFGRQSAVSGVAGEFVTRIVTVERPPVDETPPVVTASVSGSERDGWYTDRPTVSWSVTEDASNIVSEQLLMAVGTNPPTVVGDGCAPFQITEDTNEAGITLTCIATSDAWDANARAFQSTTAAVVTIRHDDSPPDVSYLLAGGTASAVEGWWTGVAPTVDWSIDEPHSTATLGFDCAPGPVVEGEQALSCTAISAGGETTVETETIRFDDTPPVLTPTVSGTEFGQGWYTGEVTVSWDATDVSPILDSCGATVITGETAGEAVNCSATSVGGTATGTVEVRTDFTAPAVAGTATGDLGLDGWFVGPVSVTWDVNEPLSTETLSTDCVAATFGDDTTGDTATCSATSAGGTSGGSVSFRIDRTAPELTLSGGQAVYDVSETITIACTATDATSGAGTCDGFEGQAFAFGAGLHSVSFSATNGAGLEGTASHDFEVTVSADGLAGVVATVVADANTARALNQKLESLANAKNANAARGAMQAFINQVEAKRGNGISDADADLLIALVQAIGGN